ncbi:MAG: cell wall-binding repeat-containing protein, partial [Nitriliruptorales bacterium]
MRRTVAGRAGLRPWQVPGQMKRLALPLSVSGLPGDRLAEVAAAAERAGVALVPYTGSSVRSTRTTATHLAPGSNFAAAISYGDVSNVATGTTSYVCGDDVLAFGHPFLHTGVGAYGAGAATALGIVADPVFGAFKLAVADGASGVVDQDRLAGLRADLGETPTLVPITSTIADVDTGRRRTGTTEVVSSTHLPNEFVPFTAWAHALGNLLAVVDRIGGGTATGTITVKGTRENGGTFTLRRSNRYASADEITSPPANELLTLVATIAENPFEDVAFTSVDLRATVDDSEDFLTVKEVFVDHGGGLLEPATEVFLEPGAATDFVVTLTTPSGGLVSANLSLDVPASFAGTDGTLRVGGGSLLGGDDPASCLFFPEECSVVQDADDLDGLLRELATAPRQDDLVASLEVFPVEFDLGATSDIVRAEGSTRLTKVIDGEAFVTAHVLPALGGVERIAGDGPVRTSVAVSKAGFDRADTVVVVRHDDASDALVALPLAAVLDAPILYSDRTGLPDAVADEVARLGAVDAIVVGGEGALQPAVVDDLAALGLAVERLGGRSRWDTARL